MYKVKVIKNFKFRFIKFKRLKIKIVCAYLIYRRTHSNYFLTLTDKKFKVITCVTAGNSKAGESVRRKVSPYAMEPICKRLLTFLAIYKIKILYIFVYTKPLAGFYTLIHHLTTNKIRIKKICEKIHVPHNGVRKRKIRRK